MQERSYNDISLEGGAGSSESEFGDQRHPRHAGDLAAVAGAPFASVVLLPACQPGGDGEPLGGVVGGYALGAADGGGVAAGGDLAHLDLGGLSGGGERNAGPRAEIVTDVGAVAQAERAMAGGGKPGHQALDLGIMQFEAPAPGGRIAGADEGVVELSWHACLRGPGGHAIGGYGGKLRDTTNYNGQR